MSTRKKTVLGSLVLSAGEVVVYGSSFVRNMILARMLTKADFGIAAAFSMFVTLLEFSAKLGIARFVVRDQEGDDPDFIATAHLVQAAAAFVSSLAMIAAAWPLSRVFGITEHVGALFVLATVPIFNGLIHLDVRRFERTLRFGPSTTVEMIPQVVITLCAWPAAKWLGDYRAMLLLLVMKAFFSCVGSHVLAVQPYRWRLHREYVVRMLRFGWPLLANGLLMFGVMQGDQFLVATFYSMADLAPYAAAAALTMAPSFVFSRIFGPVALPVLARVQADARAFGHRYRVIVGTCCAFSAAYSSGMILGCEALMRLAYGEKYSGSGIILGWLAAANSFRNVRLAPATAALARGDSVNQLVSNAARVLALVPALAVAVARQPVWVVACAGLVGEALACGVSFWRLSTVHGVPMSNTTRPTLLVGMSVLAAGAVSWGGIQRLGPVPSLLLAVLGAGCSGAIVVALLEDLRREAVGLREHFRSEGMRGLWELVRASRTS